MDSIVCFVAVCCFLPCLGCGWSWDRLIVIGFEEFVLRMVGVLGSCVCFFGIKSWLGIEEGTEGKR